MGRFIRIMHLELVLIYLVLLLLFVGTNTYLPLVLNTPAYIIFLKYVVIGVFLLNVFFTHYVQRVYLYHPYMMFLGLMFLFILGKIFLDVIIPHINFAQTTFLTSYIYSEDVQVKMLRTIIFSLLSLQLGASVAFHKTKKLDQKNILKFEPSWVRVGLLFFYVGLPFLVYQNVQMALEIMKKGYLTFHTDQVLYSNSMIITLFSRFSLVGFFIYLSGMPSIKSMYLNMLVFFVFVMTPMLMQGMRGPVMCLLLTLLWYVLYRKNIKLKKLFLLAFIAVMIILNSFIAFMRFDKKFEFQDQMMVRFLFRQGISLQVIGYAITYEEEMSEFSFPNLFANLELVKDNIISRIIGDKQKLTNIEKADKYGYVGYWIAKIANPRKLEKGNTNGSSYLAEYYLIGRDLAQIIASFCIGFFTVFLVEKGRMSRGGILFLLFFLPSWLYIPRDNTFDFITDNVSNVVFVLLSLMMIVLFQRNHNRKNADNIEKVNTYV